MGASVNDVLKKHRQTTFEPGDIELFPKHDSGSERLDSALYVQNVNISPDDPRLLIPGRSVILKRDWIDKFPHRFIWEEMNTVAAVTNIPYYDDRPEAIAHYGEAHEDFAVYGLSGIYKDTHRANVDIVINVLP